MEPAAESHPRIQTDGRGPGLKVGLLPGRHNPEAPADPEGAKVRLPDGGPGFVCDRFDDERRRRRPQPKRGQRGEAAPEVVEPPIGGHNLPQGGAQAGPTPGPPPPPPPPRPPSRLREEVLHLFHRDLFCGRTRSPRRSASCSRTWCCSEV